MILNNRPSIFLLAKKDCVRDKSSLLPPYMHICQLKCCKYSPNCEWNTVHPKMSLSFRIAMVVSSQICSKAVSVRETLMWASWLAEDGSGCLLFLETAIKRKKVLLKKKEKNDSFTFRMLKILSVKCGSEMCFTTALKVELIMFTWLGRFVMVLGYWGYLMSQEMRQNTLEGDFGPMTKGLGKVIQEIQLSRMALKMDKRLTGSSIIDEPLQEVKS